MAGIVRQYETKIARLEGVMEIIATSKNLELINKPLNIVTVKKNLG